MELFQFASVIAIVSTLSGSAFAQTRGPAVSSPGAPMSAAPPENCQIVLSEADMNYGATTRYGLESSGNARELALDVRRINLSVSCREPVMIGVRFRGPSAGADYLFGKQGKVTMQATNPRLDGRNVLVGSANAAGMQPITPADRARFMPGEVIVPVEGGKPAVGKQFATVVEITPSLPADAARVRNRTPMETAGAFEVVWR